MLSSPSHQGDDPAGGEPVLDDLGEVPASEELGDVAVDRGEAVAGYALEQLRAAECETEHFRAVVVALIPEWGTHRLDHLATCTRIRPKSAVVRRGVLTRREAVRAQVGSPTPRAA